MKQLYLVALEGDGDMLKLVSKAAWDYIDQPAPDFQGETSVHEKPPRQVQEECFESFANNPYIPEKNRPKQIEDVAFHVTTGSLENDRALHLIGIHTASSHMELMAICKEHDIEIIDEWQGYVY